MAILTATRTVITLAVAALSALTATPTAAPHQRSATIVIVDDRAAPPPPTLRFEELVIFSRTAPRVDALGYVAPELRAQPAPVAPTLQGREGVVRRAGPWASRARVS